MISFPYRFFQLPSTTEGWIANNGIKTILRKDLWKLNRPMEWAAGSGLAGGEIVGEVGGSLLFQNCRLERIAAEKRLAFDCRRVKSCRSLFRWLARHKDLADEIAVFFVGLPATRTSPMK